MRQEHAGGLEKMSDSLLQPDIPELVEKWRHVVDRVREENKFDTIAELSWLAEAASIHGETIIECGSYTGISTKVMALANPKSKIWCFDDWADAGSQEAFFSRMAPEFQEGRINYMKGSTADVMATSMLAGGSASLIFLDASHLYSDMVEDIKCAIELLEPGGVLCGHDYRINLPEDGVTKATLEAFPNLVIPCDSIWAVQR